MHGYDTIDPTRLNPELGDEEDFRRLVHALRHQEMGLIIDVVPNHMAVGSDNRWWMDVLTHGRHSPYAKFFDIDWDRPDLGGKVLLPVLGQPYGDVLSAGEIVVQRTTGSNWAVHYFDKFFPLSPDTAAASGDEMSSVDRSSDSGRAHLHRLLEGQNYRLAWWRCANDEINWRRFFDINELAAIRIEDDEVFETVHSRILDFYAKGLIDGLRVDHVDGLAHPSDYCRKLRARLSNLEKLRPSTSPPGPAFLVVEKILAHDEQLPGSWQVDGTTGYDFMDEVSLVQHAKSGENPMSRLWHLTSGRPAYFADEEELARRQIIERSFSAQRESLVNALYQIAQANIMTRDYSRAAIRRCITEILAHFSVYRIYAEPDEISASDRRFLCRAVERATGTCIPGDRTILRAVGKWLLGETELPQGEDRQAIAQTRFQQLSAPLSAKAVEDTALYRYGRLLSRNDVGFDAARFSCTIGQFHERMKRRREAFSGAMLATATHDHKRGEDVRARLAALSEHSLEWELAIAEWLELSQTLRVASAGETIPTKGDLLILFQTIVGAWPTTLTVDDSVGLNNYAKRIVDWQRKALREAKLHTDWADPDLSYEQSAASFVENLFNTRSSLLEAIADFSQNLMLPGIANSLSQLLAKLTCPGVPDIYQGTEFWDLSLVDPDNRTAVDYVARRDALHSASLQDLIAGWRDGQIKQHVLTKVLAVRQRTPRLFAQGDYIPLEVKGLMADHVLAFARISPPMRAIAVLLRLPARLLRGAQMTVPISEWQDTRLIVPESLCQSFVDQIAGDEIKVTTETEVAPILSRLPVAFLSD